MSNPKKSTVEEIIPSLKEALANFKPEIKPADYHVAIATTNDGRPAQGGSSDVPVVGGEEYALWKAPNLSQLFRGDVQPPDLALYPGDYVPYLYFIERHAFHFFANFTPVSDQNMESIYANLARRPDGKINDPMHHLLWQAAALMLAIYPLSQPQYEAIMRRLANSCASFAKKPVSRNYAAHIKQMFDR
ncbi:MAG: hypothetical protein ACO1QB_16135 [Verrucomicrobiales bacterium]